MSTIKKPLGTLIIFAASLLGIGLLGRIALGEDAVTADPTHYKVEFENDKVRVIRITYGPGEKSVMHEHLRAGVTVSLTDSHTMMTLPDGTSTEDTGEAGVVAWAEPSMHMPANVGDEPFELIYVEIKD